MGQSYVIKKERCPECEKLGKDRNGDNLAVYSDMHKFCYSCGYTIFPSGLSSFLNKIGETEDKKEHMVYLPSDCDTTYPQRALAWIEKYELTKTDLLVHNTLWSETEQRLIFPIYGEENQLIAWQGRDFNIIPVKHRKWFGRGNLKDTFNLLGQGNKLVLCEDIISAIKLSKCNVMAMPLYGSFVSRERVKRLYSMFGKEIEVLVYLDYDKATEGTQAARRGSIYGLHCRAIIDKLDPKENSYQKLKEILVC